jgi:hypothetical protein
MPETVTTQLIRLRCAGGHAWEEAWPVPCLLTQFVARLKAASTCPTCGKTTFLDQRAVPA